MPIQTPLEKWGGKVREITLGATKAEGGTRSRTVTVGGETTLPFLHFEGQAKDSPPGCPTGLFGNSLQYLRDNEHHRHPSGGRGGMVYWQDTTLRKIAELSDVLEQNKDQP